MQAATPLQEIQFITPKSTRAVTLTGRNCAMSCAHCAGHYLKGMASPQSIRETEDQSYSSLLISGGCLHNGEVPLADNASHLMDLKEKGFRLNLHAGPGASQLPPEIVDMADVISLDCVTDRRTIKEVYGFPHGESVGVELFGKLKNRVHTVPHITVGLHEGRIRGEIDALAALQELGAEEIVFLILIPTEGTRYAHCAPPEIGEVERVFLAARALLPGAVFSLGCMRPGGSYRARVDNLAYEMAFDKIVMPSHAVRMRALREEKRVIEGWECCAL